MMIGQTGGQTDRPADRKTDKQTGGRADRQIDRQTGKPTVFYVKYNCEK